MKSPAFATPQHLKVARSYIAASELVLSNATNLLESDAPGYFLLAHGAELALKASLSWSHLDDSEISVLGHNLTAAFDKLKKVDAAFASSIEEHVSQKWRAYLRGARDARVKTFEEFGISSPEVLCNLGLPTNAEIGNQKPTFRADLRWLSERHVKEGSQFRYLKTGRSSRPRVNAFGLDEETVPRSISWGCIEILQRLDREIRKSLAPHP